MKNDGTENIISLQNFYFFIEKYALSLEKDHNLVETFLKYKSKINSDEEKQFLQWGIEVFLFSFRRGRLFSFSTDNGMEIGEVAEYPTWYRRG